MINIDHILQKINLIEFYIRNNAILNDIIYCGLIKYTYYIYFISDDCLEKLNDPNNDILLDNYRNNNC